ncbi:cytosolic Fe-S cluster assembly factor CFD1 [Globomyces pollinis-pini]|nr:cytosolic Fe-S cluster assembly factor CFD1 [Globomyces pollinis-pini]
MVFPPLPNFIFKKIQMLVLSGKGGVGKSTVTAELAISLAEKGNKVGVLDIDLTGPSLPELFGLKNHQIHQSSAGWIPVYTNDKKNLGVVSLGFLLGNNDEPVIWRGPKKNAMIKQFVNDVAWGELDYLLIDTPPGTSDEHISIVGYLKEYNPDGAVIVTTPQGISLIDVRREINFCKKVNLPILGLVENMSGFICPHCEGCTDIFSSGGGKNLAESLSIPYFGNIPLDPTLTTLIEKSNFVETFKLSNLFGVFSHVLDNFLIAIDRTHTNDVEMEKLN